MSVPTLGLTSVAAAATMKMTTSINITNASQVKAKKIFAKPRTKSTFAYKTTFARKAAIEGYKRDNDNKCVCAKPGYHDSDGICCPPEAKYN